VREILPPVNSAVFPESKKIDPPDPLSPLPIETVISPAKFPDPVDMVMDPTSPPSA